MKTLVPHLPNLLPGAQTKYPSPPAHLLAGNVRLMKTKVVIPGGGAMMTTKRENEWLPHPRLGWKNVSGSLRARFTRDTPRARNCKSRAMGPAGLLCTEQSRPLVCNTTRFAVVCLGANHRIHREHIYRCHQSPTFPCIRCQVSFEDEKRLAEHLRAGTPCETRTPSPDEETIYISRSQERELRKKKRNIEEEKRWFQCFRTIFPDIPATNTTFGTNRLLQGKTIQASLSPSQERDGRGVGVHRRRIPTSRGRWQANRGLSLWQATAVGSR